MNEQHKDTHYVLLPSFRSMLIGFLKARPASDLHAAQLAAAFERLNPSFVVSHAQCQLCVDYLKKLPYEEVFQLIQAMSVLEQVPPDNRSSVADTSSDAVKDNGAATDARIAP
jgi:hypothetical protein